MSEFLATLQQAFFNGVPFKVRHEVTSVGRQQAIHNYPFRDGVWVEDMGRKARRFVFEGHLVGDLAPLLAETLKKMCELAGPGILVHPTLGGILASLLSASFGVHHEKLRVIELQLEFIEQSPPSFASTLIATIVQTLSFVTVGQTAAASDFQRNAAPVIPSGAAIAEECSAVVTSFGADLITSGTDSAAAFTTVATLPGNFGRYASGSASSPAPAGATVSSLLEDAVSQRTTLLLATEAVATAAGTLSTTTDLMTPLVASLTALVATANNPGDAVRLLLDVITFSYTDAAMGDGLPGDIASIRDLTATLCRRAAVIALAGVSSSYQPSSYQDAAFVRDQVCNALEDEITVAGDVGDDATYVALLDLRAAVSNDLTTRGADLASVTTVTTPRPLSALVNAYALYQDSSRSDELIRRANPVHPAFMPTSFEALSE